MRRLFILFVLQLILEGRIVHLDGGALYTPDLRLLQTHFGTRGAMHIYKQKYCLLGKITQ